MLKTNIYKYIKKQNINKSQNKKNFLSFLKKKK